MALDYYLPKITRGAAGRYLLHSRMEDIIQFKVLDISPHVPEFTNINHTLSIISFILLINGKKTLFSFPVMNLIKGLMWNNLRCKLKENYRIYLEYNYQQHCYIL